MKTVVTKDDIDYAARVIRQGGLVAVPTETVYGLSANGFDSTAVMHIYEVKNRPETKPISLLVRNMSDVEKVCADIPKSAYKLADAFWPGPLTMILKRNASVPDIVTAGGNTVGVRAPRHPLTLALIEKCGVPLATPSANISGLESATNADEVLSYFYGKIECVIDGGESEFGVASTIVDLTGDNPIILRHGGLSADEIDEVLKDRGDDMKIIGLTGGTGTGKTTAMNVLKKFGALCIDADQVYHDMLRTSQPMIDEIEEMFPSVMKDGKLDRKALGEIVFNDKSKLSALNLITHKYICEEIRKMITDAEKEGVQIVAIDAVEIIESGLSAICDKMIAVTAPIKERIVRIMGREGISMGYAAMRIAAQKPDTYYAERCDIVLHNDFPSAEAFEDYCTEIFKTMLGV